MNNYAWDIELLVNYLLPSYLRKPKMEAWLCALLAPVDAKHTEFTDYVADTRYALDFTGQVISLERLLNDAFDNTLRRIYISDTTAVTEQFLFYDGTSNTASETSFVFQDGTVNTASETFWFYQDNYTGTTDFYINIPTGLTYNVAKLNALVNKYKLAGKRFTVQTF